MILNTIKFSLENSLKKRKIRFPHKATSQLLSSVGKAFLLPFWESLLIIVSINGHKIYLSFQVKQKANKIIIKKPTLTSFEIKLLHFFFDILQSNSMLCSFEIAVSFSLEY